MKLIIGLGNPGKEYEETRHNVGFMVLDRLLLKIQKDGLKWKQRVGAAVVEKFLWDVSEKILLVAPQKYMNLSGQVVTDIQRFYDVDNEDIMVICDDLNLEFGSIRTRQSGSAGNHNGLKNIIEYLGENFFRIRIGIKNQFLKSSEDWHDFVLSDFSREEKEKLPKILDLTADIVLKWVSKGANFSVKTYNIYD